MSTQVTYTRRPFQPNIPYQFSREIDSSSNVYVKVSEGVRPETILASQWKKSGFRTYLLSDLFKLPPEKCSRLLTRTIGSRIYQGDIIAVKREMFGMREKSFRSPLTGLLVDYDENTSRLTLQYLPEEIKVVAGVFGTVIGIVPNKELQIGTLVDLIYGLVTFGVDREGSLLEVGYPDIPLQTDQISERCKGHIVFGGTKVSVEVLYKALSVGVRAVITGGVDYQDFLFLRGSKGRLEDIGISLIATEGFTSAPIYPFIYQKLKEVEHRHVLLDARNSNLIVPLPYSEFAEREISELKFDQMKPPRGFGPVKKESVVRILSGKYLGDYGIVTVIEKDEVEVKLQKDSVRIPVNNIEVILQENE